MKPLSILTDASLRFHADDAAAAVSANPRSPKAPQYLAELHACERELERRARLRLLRATVARDPADRLALPLKHRRHYWPNNYARSGAADASLALAFLRVCRPE